MPAVIDKAWSHRALFARRRVKRGDREGPVPLDDVKALYLQSVRLIETSMGSVVLYGAESGFDPVSFDPSHLQGEGVARIYCLGGKAASESFGIAWKKYAKGVFHSNLGKGFLLKRRFARRQPPHETFVSRAQRLEKMARTDAALDLIYDAADEMMRTAEFRKLDSILANTRVSDLSVDILLGVLTATLPAKSHLASRTKLFKETERVLKERGEYEEGLLTGLE